jgi:hypothetical protein
MERERPFIVNGNNGALKRQAFPLILNETSTIQSRSVLINALLASCGSVAWRRPVTTDLAIETLTRTCPQVGL